MRVKRFVGDSVTEIMSKIKQDLGHDAVILQTRQFKEGGFMGLFGQSKVEITAAWDDPVKLPGAARPGTERLGSAGSGGSGRSVSWEGLSGDGTAKDSLPAETERSSSYDASTEKLLKTIAQARMQNALEAAAAGMRTRPETASSEVSAEVSVDGRQALRPFSQGSAERMAQVFPGALARTGAVIQGEMTQGEVKEMMSMMREIHHYLNAESGGSGFVPDVLQKWRDYLCRRGVSEDMCRELLFQVQIHLKREHWHDDRRVLALLKKNILAKCAHTQIIDVRSLKQTGRPLVMALVGPTGVGKTTTIGKLSAGFSIVESRKVGLVAADTYRVAAVEQLRTFGEILGIPVEVVMSAPGLEESIAKHADKDVIIIDTAGRSPNHIMHMGELEEFMEAARPDITLLVMSATTHPEEQELVLERFRPLSTHLILTKLDESRCEGSLLDLVTRTDLPLTYVTHGQNVPEDIDVATPEKLMNWILGEGVISDVS